MNVDTLEIRQASRLSSYVKVSYKRPERHDTPQLAWNLVRTLGIL